MRTSSLWFVLALASCGKDQAKATDQKPATPAPAPAPTTVQIFVNDAPVGTIAMEQLKLWPRLDALVPSSARHLGSWQDLTFKASNAAPLHQPSASYPDFVPALFPGDDGKPSFALFDPGGARRARQARGGAPRTTSRRSRLSSPRAATARTSKATPPTPTR